jgi:hypothetical protein
MGTFLKSISTGFYYKAGGEWTDKLGEAFDFKSVRPALEFAHRAGLKPKRLAVTFGAAISSTVPLRHLQEGIQSLAA